MQAAQSSEPGKAGQAPLALRRTLLDHRQRELLQGKRVLLVEDNEVNIEVAVAVLGQAGIEVTVARNGLKALDLLEEAEAFDLALMDCQMPELDGYEATRRIRRNARFDRLAIIAMTANVMQEDRHAATAAGMDDYICKPLDLTILFATLARWAEHPRQPAISPSCP